MEMVYCMLSQLLVAVKEKNLTYKVNNSDFILLYVGCRKEKKKGQTEHVVLLFEIV